MVEWNSLTGVPREKSNRDWGELSEIDIVRTVRVRLMNALQGGILKCALGLVLATMTSTTRADKSTEHLDAVDFNLEAALNQLPTMTMGELLTSVKPIPTVDDIIQAPMLDHADHVKQEKPGLNDEVQQKVNTLESELKTLRASAKYTDAVQIALSIVAVYEKNLGRPNWKTMDAKSLATTLKCIVDLPTEAREALARTDASDSQIEKLWAEAKYDDALALSRNQLTARLKYLGDEPTFIIPAINNIAQIHGAKAQHAQAERYYMFAIGMMRSQLAETNIHIAEILNNLATLKYNQGRYATSIALALKSASIRRDIHGRSHVSVTECMTNAAASFEALGEYESAERLYRRVVTVRRSLFQEPHVSLARSINNFGVLLHTKGDLAGAESLYREALTMREELMGNKHPYVGASLNNLAALLKAGGRFDEAESMQREGLSILRNGLGDKHPYVASSMNNLASLLVEKGDYHNAIPFYRDSLASRQATLGGDHPDVAASLNNLALALQYIDEYDEAEKLQRNAIQVLRKRSHSAPRVLAKNLNNLAFVLEDKGNAVEAEELHREALSIRRKHLGDKHQDVAMSLVNLSRMLRDKGDVTQAKRLCAEALEIHRHEFGGDHPSVVSNLHILARMQRHSGDLSAAESNYRVALTTAENIRPRIVGSERSRASFAGALSLPQITSGLAEILIRKGQVKEAFNVVERGKARAFLDLLAQSDRDLVMESSNSLDGAVVDRLSTALQSEQKARVHQKSAEVRLSTILGRDDLSEDKKSQLAEEQRAEIQDKQRLVGAERASVFAKLRDVWPDARALPIDSIREALSVSEWLISFVWSSDEILVFVVPPPGPQHAEAVVIARGDAEVKSLGEMARRLHHAISVAPSNHNNTLAIQKLSHELYQRLLPEEVRRRMDSAIRVVFVLDGPLRDLPLEVLLASNGRGWAAPSKSKSSELSSGTEIVYAESGTVFHNRRDRAGVRAVARPNGFSALILGAPVFHRKSDENTVSTKAGEDTPTASRTRGEWAGNVASANQIRLFGGKLPALPGTRKEAEIIAQIINQAGGTTTMLLGEDANKLALDRSVAGQRYVHLATHGLLGSSRQPYAVSMALTSPTTPSSEDFGYLTLDHLIRRWRGKLKHCDLVVLSGCATRQGTTRGGSVMALPWGFMYAGAPSVIASLWEVDDTVTAAFMKRLYENLLGNYVKDRGRFSAGSPMPKSAALHEAKLWLRSLSHLPDSPIRSRGGLSTNSFKEIAKAERYDLSHPYYWSGFILLGSPD